MTEPLTLYIDALGRDNAPDVVIDGIELSLVKTQQIPVLHLRAEV